MKRWFSPERHWWRLLLIVLLLLVLGAAVRWWAQPLLAFVSDNTDLIQGLTDALQLIFWAGAALLLIYNFVRPAPTPAPQPPPAPPLPTAEVIVAADPETLWRLINQQRPPADLTALTKRYLDYLVERYRYLDFRGMGVHDRLPPKLPLLDLYVPLKARIEVPEGETWARHLYLAGRRLSETEIEATGQRLSEPQALAGLLSANAGLIILGDPGAGKSTFLKFLALSAATGQLAALGLGARLPFLLPLAAYANALAKADLGVEQWIVDYYRGLGVDHAFDLAIGPMLTAALRSGGALLLLDGLDEVRNAGLRRLVVDRVVDFFLAQRVHGNKFVLTSRIVGYKEVRPAVEGLAECTLVDFDEEEIKLFVEKWTGALERAQRGDTIIAAHEAANERRTLLTAVERNPGVRQLAANPLLLTILALIKRQGIELPERRVELYDTYVKTLLHHWHLARSQGRPLSRDLDVQETLKLLAPLALWMHETSPGVGLVDEADVVRKLEELCRARGMNDPEGVTRRFLADVHDESALLLERGQRQYGFIHLTFQEYLAAVAVAQRGQLGIAPVVDALAAHIHDPNWHEVSLLTIGHLGLVLQYETAAGAVLEGLLQGVPGEAGQAAVLAGECVADAWPGVTPACRDRVIAALTNVLTDETVTPVRRAAAGRTLAHRNLGAPRPQVTELAAMQFCFVAAGPFMMGSDDEPPEHAENRPMHRATVAHDYWIGRYPVTNTQFHAFVLADGYGQTEFWSEAIQHELWKDGQIKRYYGYHDENRKVQLADEWANVPANFGETYTLPNHPVVGVSWYEALAFSRWLTRDSREKGLLPETWFICLPTEAEWEKAARGGLTIPATYLVRPLATLFSAPIIKTRLKNPAPLRTYPWGDEFDVNRANLVESAIGKTSAVGIFPNSVSPYGVEELSGNVYEWTRSLWGSRSEAPDSDYPYKADDGREDFSAKPTMARILRGGSWVSLNKRVHCAVRDRYYPYIRLSGLGLRLVCAPITRPESVIHPLLNPP